VTLFQLQAWEAVGFHKSIARAAVELGLAEPTISKQIKALQKGIGYPLWRRNGQAIAITKYGTKVTRFARLVVEAEFRLKKQLRKQ